MSTDLILIRGHRVQIVLGQVGGGIGPTGGNEECPDQSVGLHHLLGRELVGIAIVKGEADDVFGTAATLADSPSPDPTSVPTVKANETSRAKALLAQAIGSYRDH